MQLTAVHAVRRTGSSRQPDPRQKKPDDHKKLCGEIVSRDEQYGARYKFTNHF